jgi:hypothetical protein
MLGHVAFCALYAYSVLRAVVGLAQTTIEIANLRLGSLREASNWVGKRHSGCSLLHDYRVCVGFWGASWTFWVSLGPVPAF